MIGLNEDNSYYCIVTGNEREDWIKENCWDMEIQNIA